MGLYQIRFLKKVPDYAAVDDAVRLAQQHHLNTGLVNAVLRKTTSHPAPELPQSGFDFLTITLSLPRWLAQRWVRHFGDRRAVDYAQAGLERPGLHLAVNTSRTTPAALMIELAKEEIACAPQSQEALLKVMAGNPVRSNAFRQGLFYIMGPSSYAVAEIAAYYLQDPTLDCCASPGGKLIHLKLAGSQILCGADRTFAKIALIRQNLHRMHIDGVRLVVGDFSTTPPIRSSFSTILLDAPCSGLGVISKLPEIKWRTRENDIARLAHQQSRILQNCFSLLAPRGRLIYSVCSLEPEEGQEIILAFLEKNKGAHVETLDPGFAHPDKDGFYRFFPMLGMLDGFFAAVLTKK